MVSLKVISDWLKGLLNTNEKKIVFDIQADRNVYDTARRNVEGFVVPGVLTELQGSYEPLKAIKVYNMPVMLELWGFSGLHGEPFDAEDQKAIVGGVVEELNGNTYTFGDDAIIVSAGNVTVGEATGQGGGGYVRIPILVTLQLTVVQKAVMSNDVVLEIDGERVYATEFTYSLSKQNEPKGTPNKPTLKAIFKTQQRICRGNFFFMAEDGIFKTLYNESFSDSLNIEHVLKVDDKQMKVSLQDFALMLPMGGIARVEMTFLER